MSTTFQHEPHDFKKRWKFFPWVVCRYCGLVALRNEFTKWCIGKGCNYQDHPGYQKAMRG